MIILEIFPEKNIREAASVCLYPYIPKNPAIFNWKKVYIDIANKYIIGINSIICNISTFVTELVNKLNNDTKTYKKDRCL